MANILEGRGIRVKIDDRNEKLGYKIRQGRLEKIPYLLVMGDREEESQTVAVRQRSDGDLGGMTLEAFLDRVGPEMSSGKPTEI